MTGGKPVVVLDASIPRDPSSRVAELRTMASLILPDGRGDAWPDEWHHVLYASPVTLSGESVVGHEAAMQQLYLDSRFAC